MASSLRQASPQSVAMGPTTSEIAFKGLWPSMVSSVLPTIMPNRLSTLFHVSESPNAGSGSSTEVLTPETPPPIYTSRAASISPNRLSVEPEPEDILRDDDFDRPDTAFRTPPAFAVTEPKTGIKWQHANQGVSLTSQAYQESSAPTHEISETSAILTRLNYIHGMTYLLRGLPADLTPEEILSLQAAMPQGLFMQRDLSSAPAMKPAPRDGTISPEGATPSTSVLHRVTATIVFEMFVLIYFLIPYIKLCIGYVYRFEREHRVIQKFMNVSTTTVQKLGQRSLQLSHTICQMNDGQVGEAINDLAFWWVRGLTGGIQQGIAEGVSMLERPTTPRGRAARKQD